MGRYLFADPVARDAGHRGIKYALVGPNAISPYGDVPHAVAVSGIDVIQ